MDMKTTIVRLEVRLEVDASYDVKEVIDEMNYDFKFENAIVNTEIQNKELIK